MTPLLAALEQHTDAAAAETDPRGQGDGHGEVHRHRRVDRGAAVTQHLAADQHGAGFVARDHAGKALDRCENAGLIFLFAGAKQQRREQQGGQRPADS